jgi:hypothetical protein
MVHRNAPLSETGRLRLARCVVDEGWPLRRAAERFQVSVTTAARWAARYRALGDAGMADRSCKLLVRWRSRTCLVRCGHCSENRRERCQRHSSR